MELLLPQKRDVGELLLALADEPRIDLGPWKADAEHVGAATERDDHPVLGNQCRLAEQVPEHRRLARGLVDLLDPVAKTGMRGEGVPADHPGRVRVRRGHRLDLEIGEHRLVPAIQVRRLVASRRRR